jgi:hypothetical protein
MFDPQRDCYPHPHHRNHSDSHVQGDIYFQAYVQQQHHPQSNFSSTAKVSLNDSWPMKRQQFSYESALQSYSVPYTDNPPDMLINMNLPLVEANSFLSSDMNGRGDNAANDSVCQGTYTAKRARSNHLWLQIVSETCHSVRELKSGEDLTHKKKKYKQFFCLYCADYNPATPWAKAKARKFEKHNLIAHENSSHHMKAVAARQSMSNSVSGMKILSNVNSNTHGSYDQIPSLEEGGQCLVQETIAADVFRDMTDVTASAHLQQAQTTSLPLPIHELDMHTSLAQPFSPFSTNNETKIESNLQLINFISSNNEEMQLRSRLRMMRAWYCSFTSLLSFAGTSLCFFICNRLHVEGNMVQGHYQDKCKKKKFKLFMCKVCAQYNPTAPWAKMRLRKFETVLLDSHEKSQYHKKACELAAADPYNVQISPYQL